MKGFYIYDLSILISVHANCADLGDLGDLCRSWWTSGMIPEKVTWVQFPATTSTVYSELLPLKDLVFIFLIKHQHQHKHQYKF